MTGQLDPADTGAVLDSLRRVVRAEGSALLSLSDSMGEPFAEAVRWMADCRGRILVSGLGKSGLVARKIAATLTGTGTPALFVHPVEALHGDLGIATQDDILLVVSRSGGNEELLSLVSSLAVHEVRSIGLTTEAQSALARQVDLILHTPMDNEACPLGLSPTTSTTLATATGDALAMGLLEVRGFRREDFAILHPSGALGRGLRMTVRELMHQGEELPVVSESATLREALLEMSVKRLGCTCVVGADGKLVGFLSDGDFRRILEQHDMPLELPVRELMSGNPVSVQPACLARVALRKMETNRPGPITQLVVQSEDKPLGILHIHDVLRVGIRAN